MFPSLSSETLSRLKGIETDLDRLVNISSYNVRKHFPVWRELKPISAIVLFVTVLVRKHFPVWRELKPLKISWFWYGCLVFGNTFPFEGNWNIKKILIVAAKGIFVRKHFPVWRELKPDIFECDGNCISSSETLSRLKGIETCTHIQLLIFRHL